MKRVQYILVMLALLGAGMPCGHAALHADHHSGHETAPCELACEPCRCHSCDHEPCAAKIDIQFEWSVQPVLHRPSCNVVFACAAVDTRRPAVKQTMPHTGPLDVLQTVQLLI